MTLFYSTILAVATFIWGYIFYKKEYHPQPLRVIAQSFIAGAFSMLPVFGYRYVYLHFIPMIEEHEIIRPLLSSSVLSGLFFFLLNMLLVATLLTVLASIISLVLTRFKHDTLENIRGTLRDDEFEYVTMSTMIALLIYGERVAEKIFNITIIKSITGAIMFLAIIEEYVKHLTVRFIDDKRIKDIDDAITLSIVVGLAFSFIETIIYGIAVGDMGIILPRALLSMPIHVIASGIFGYYYGLAKFADEILKAKHKEGRYNIRFKWFHMVLRMKKSDVYEEEKTAQGLVLATLFHTVANLLFEFNLAYITVPVIVLGLIVLTYFYKESHVLYRLLNKRKL
ncbi:MAG: PrsW family intramembrane metalloprotease [Candidatus Peregrinibacteria bacterium]|nr:PrsW family intramembrane metalloprotease [Candidatus Peregrinibacteria bacterium]